MIQDGERRSRDSRNHNIVVFSGVEAGLKFNISAALRSPKGLPGNKPQDSGSSLPPPMIPRSFHPVRVVGDSPRGL